MKRTLYLVTLYCHAEPQGYISRNIKQPNDSTAILWATEWLQKSRVTYKRMTHLFDRWSLVDLDAGPTGRMVAMGDVNQIRARGADLPVPHIPRQRS